MRGHLHLHHCILSQYVYAEVDALLMRLHKLHSDITEPLSVYHRYQCTSAIALTASPARPSQRLNFADKVLLHGLQ